MPAELSIEPEPGPTTTAWGDWDGPIPDRDGVLATDSGGDLSDDLTPEDGSE